MLESLGCSGLDLGCLRFRVEGVRGQGSGLTRHFHAPQEWTTPCLMLVNQGVLEPGKFVI